MAGFDVNRLDDVIHGRLRLGVMAYLSSVDVADFNELKAALQATQGNLSIQLRKLADAGYIDIEKGYLGTRPHTRLRITESGRAAFKAYLDNLQRLLEQAGGASNAA